MDSRRGANEQLVKVLFSIEQDDEGYPPVSGETLWARPTEDGFYELDNSPFYAVDVSWKDVVDAEPMSEHGLKFKKVVRRSGHSTIRVIALQKDELPILQKKLEKLQCSWEGSDLPSLITVDIPPSVDIHEVMTLLQEGSDERLFDYEEASIQHV